MSAKGCCTIHLLLQNHIKFDAIICCKTNDNQYMVIIGVTVIARCGQLVFIIQGWINFCGLVDYRNHENLFKIKFSQLNTLLDCQAHQCQTSGFYAFDIIRLLLYYKTTCTTSTPQIKDYNQCYCTGSGRLMRYMHTSRCSAKNIAQFSVHISRNTIPKNPENYQLNP